MVDKQKPAIERVLSFDPQEMALRGRIGDYRLHSTHNRQARAEQVAGDPVEEFHQHLGELWAPRSLVPWRTRRAGTIAEIRLEGTPPDTECRLIIHIPDRPWPAGSFNLIWDGKRVRSLDLEGPAHQDYDGTRVPTPHKQWFDEAGRERAQAVDLAGEGITNLQGAFYWFRSWCRIQWDSMWTDPSIQPPLPKMQKGRRGK